MMHSQWYIFIKRLQPFKDFFFFFFFFFFFHVQASYFIMHMSVNLLDKTMKHGILDFEGHL